LFVTDDTTPATFVWLIILTHVRELSEREAIVGATLAAGAFVLGEEGCEFVWASRETPTKQAKMRKQPILFIIGPFEVKPPTEMTLPG
jgi:hypothetical protein